MRTGLAILALVVWFPGAAAAQLEIVINNGDAPPNPANVIDSWADWTKQHFVIVFP